MRYCATTIKTYGHGKMSWQKGIVAGVERMGEDAAKHGGELCGNLGFNGTTGYKIVTGVSFASQEARDAFLAEFAEIYWAKATDAQLRIGIDQDDIDF